MSPGVISDFLYGGKNNKIPSAFFLMLSYPYQNIQQRVLQLVIPTIYLKKIPLKQDITCQVIRLIPQRKSRSVRTKYVREVEKQERKAKKGTAGMSGNITCVSLGHYAG